MTLAGIPSLGIRQQVGRAVVTSPKVNFFERYVQTGTQVYETDHTCG